MRLATEPGHRGPLRPHPTCARRLSYFRIGAKKPLDLGEWTLRPYIDVAFELGWISKSGKDVAAVLRDYRNYVHPEKERSHGVVLTEGDSAMFWEVTKSLVRQLLSQSSPKP